MEVLKHGILFEEENSIQKIAAAVVCSFTKERKKKVPWSREIVYGGSMDTLTG